MAEQLSLPIEMPTPTRPRLSAEELQKARSLNDSAISIQKEVQQMLTQKEFEALVIRDAIREFREKVSRQYQIQPEQLYIDLGTGEVSRIVPENDE